MSRREHVRIHIFGASGCGVTTLGAGLSRVLAVPVLDNDEVYWQKTDPPFRRQNPVELRRQKLETFYDAHQSWINSGTMDSWGAIFIERFTHVIYLTAPADVRIARLERREAGRYGPRILESGDMYKENQEFIEWARHYDAGTLAGRSRPRDQKFIAKLGCPLLEIDASLNQNTVLATAVRWLSVSVTST